jgi:CRP/FNR family cyclic AMP-dependent transcriptional regulator
MLGHSIANIPLFKELNANQIDLIRPMVEICLLPQNRMVFEQGDKAVYLYIVLEGEVEIRYKPYDGPVITVTRVRPGGVFGWSSAMGHEIYTSSAFCTTPTEVFRIAGRDLHCLCENYPETGTIILECLANVIAERLRSTHAQILSLLGQATDGSGDCSRRQ